MKACRMSWMEASTGYEAFSEAARDLSWKTFKNDETFLPRNWKKAALRIVLCDKIYMQNEAKIDSSEESLGQRGTWLNFSIEKAVKFCEQIELYKILVFFSKLSKIYYLSF